MPPFPFFMDVLSPFNVYSHMLRCLCSGPVSPQSGWFQGLSSQGTTCVAELERMELESCSSWCSFLHWLYFFQRSTRNQTSDLVFEWINGARIASAFHLRETGGQMASVSLSSIWELTAILFLIPFISAQTSFPHDSFPHILYSMLFGAHIPWLLVYK